MIQLLEGVRVIECAALYNGDITGRILADLGADVIKVEPPGSGDPLRNVLGAITPHNSPAHLFCNRNKRSMTIDLRDEAGKDAFFRLLATADMFIDGFAPNACDKLGIGYDEQCRRHPGIVYIQCTGFGASGPYASLPAHGFMMGSVGGSAKVQTDDEGVAVRVGGGLDEGSSVGATFAALAGVAALHRRMSTGEGAYIDASGTDAVLATCWSDAIYGWNDERIQDRSTLASVGANGAGAKYGYYETRDKRHLMFCSIEPKFWKRFCAAVERPDLVGDAESSSQIDFGSGDEQLAEELRSIFRTGDLEDWVTLAAEAGFSAAPVNDPQGLLDDRQLATREIVVRENHPDAGDFISIGWPAPVRGQPFEIARPAPALGAHTTEIMQELGYSDDQEAK